MKVSDELQSQDDAARRSPCSSCGRTVDAFEREPLRWARTANKVYEAVLLAKSDDQEAGRNLTWHTTTSMS